MVQLVLAAVAAALCLVERSYGRSADDAQPGLNAELAATPHGAAWFLPFRYRHFYRRMIAKSGPHPSGSCTT